MKSVAGETALHFASKSNHVTLLPVLLEYKAEIDITDGRGMTPLMAAAHHGNYDSFEFNRNRLTTVDLILILEQVLNSVAVLICSLKPEQM